MPATIEREPEAKTDVTGILGPIFVREVTTLPRAPRHYVARTVYTGVLFILLWTAWQAIVGFQQVRLASDTSRFAAPVTYLLAWVQTGLVLFFAPILCASSITTEKDRRTFLVLLVTDLTNWEIVFGKLASSLLQLFVLVLAAVPVFALTSLLGGASVRQILFMVALTLATAVAAGALGILMATWRDRTFQTLALTVICLAMYLLLTELSGAIVPAHFGLERDLWLAAINPVHAIRVVLDPTPPDERYQLLAPAIYAAGCMAVATLLTAIAVWKLRDWNPNPKERTVEPEELVEFSDDLDPETLRRYARPARPPRHVWDNPILWREIRTRAYGRRPVLIKAGYALFFSLLCAAFVASAQGPDTATRLTVAQVLVPVVVVSLMLINAQAVTSFTTERDLRSLDLLLVTDLTPQEFVIGKIVGALYNTKEMWLLPVGLCCYLWLAGYVGLEAWIYLIVAFMVLVVFAITVGLHAGITFEKSRVAIANALGIVFLLFVGVLICVFLILTAGRFESQLASFIVFIFAGSVALYASLAARNPSGALALTAAMCPFLTWWCIVHLLPRGLHPGGDPLGGFVIVVLAYGFAILSMLVPAVSEFDIALGRTVAVEE